MSELNLNRVEAMLAHLKARGVTVSVSGGVFSLQSPAGDIHDNDVAALRSLLQSLGLATESGAAVPARVAPAPVAAIQGHLDIPVVAVPALVDPRSPACGQVLHLPLVPRDVEVLRHKAGAWFSSPLGVGATLFAILLARYQQKEDWLRELGVAIGQQAGPGEAPHAWFALAPLIRRLPADGSLREVVALVAEHLLEASVSPGDALDLALALPDSHDEDQLVWHFAGDLFDEAFVRQLHADFVAIMRQATALITPMMSAISLYGPGSESATASRQIIMPEALSAGVMASAASEPEAVPREASALWRTVQAVIDDHASQNANTGSALSRRADATPERQAFPLSPQQWAFVLDEHQHGIGARHNITAACFMGVAETAGALPRMAGVVDLERAQKALAALMKRHALLRTTIEWQDAPQALLAPIEGGPLGACQWIQAAPPLPWRALVVSTTDDLATAARQWLADAASQPVSLFSGLPWQASVATVSNGVESASVWRLTLHNAVADRFAADRLLAEWQTLYAGESLPMLSEQYSDYCIREQASLTTNLQMDQQSETWAFWQDNLQSLNPVRWPLYGDQPEVGVLATDVASDTAAKAGGTQAFTLDAELMQRVRVAATAWQVTTQSVLLTAFATLLRRYVEQDRFVIGVEFANRHTDYLRAVPGLVSNLLPFVAQLDDGRPAVRHRVEQTHGQLLDISFYQSTPLLSVMPLLASLRQGGQSPITFAFSCQEEMTEPARQMATRGLQVLPVGQRQPRVALGLNLRCSEWQATEGELEYQAGWLSAALAADFVDQYIHVLGAMVNDANAAVTQLPLLSLTRQQEMFDLFNRDAQSLPSFLPHFSMWWQRQCYSAPQGVAVVAAEGRMSFAELDTLANQIARYLQSQEIGAGDRIGLMLPRDPILLATVLAIFKVGAAWVPMHAHWSQDYQQAVLDDAGVSCVLHDSERLPWQGSQRALDFSISATPWHALSGDGVEDADDPAALACILYPAQPAVKPRGVSVSHRNLSALVAWGVRLFDSRSPVRAAFAQDLCADSALFEVFVTLCSGGALVLIDDLLSLPARERPTSSAAKLLSVVNHITVTPTLAGEMLRNQWLPKGLRSVVLVGEPAPQALREALLAHPGVKDVWAMQTCPENCGIDFVAHFGEHAKPAPWRNASSSKDPIKTGIGDAGVGAPIDGTQCVILDAQGQLQPWGITGDLYIGGAALVNGYWGETANPRFIRNPLTYFPTLGNTLFHTGYRACWHADGRIELVSMQEEGRVIGDGAERLRMEQRVQRVLANDQVACIMRPQSQTGKPKWAAFVRGDLPSRHYLQLLQRHLPATLCPETVTVVQQWPRDASDRLDRDALASAFVEARLAAADSAPNTLELQLLRLWQDMLGERARDIDSDFYACGGHSLLAVQLVAQLAQRYALQRVPSFTTLAQFPTPRRLARWLDAALRGEECRTSLWESLSERLAPRSVLCFQTGAVNADADFWAQVTASLPDSLAAYRVCAQLREQEDPATLVQRYVDAIEQESLPLPAVLTGHGEGAVLATAVAAEMHARGWPWLPVILLDGNSPVRLKAPVRSRTLHVNSSALGLQGRAPWPALLQGDVQWRLVQTGFQHEAMARQVANWITQQAG